MILMFDCSKRHADDDTIEPFVTFEFLINYHLNSKSHELVLNYFLNVLWVTHYPALTFKQ